MKNNSENLYFNIYDDISEVIYFVNSSCDIVYKNKAFCSKYGDKITKLSNKKTDTSIVIDKKFSSDLTKLFSSVEKIQIKFSQNHEIDKTDYIGQIVIVDQTSLCLVMEKTKVSPQIHEIKSSIEDESVYKLFFQNMTESLVIYNVITDKKNKALDFEFIAVNKSYEQSIGLTNDELKGKLLFQVFPKTEEHWKALHISAFEHKKLFKTTAFSTETNKYWELKAFPAGPKQIATLATDVTEQINFKKDIKEKTEQLTFTEEKLRAYNEHLKYTCELIKESELSYKTLFEQNNDAVLILVDGKIKDCNNRALQLMNCQPYDLIGHEFLSLSAAEGSNENFPKDNFCASLNTDEKYSLDWQIKRPDGKLVDTNILLSCYTLEGTKHVYAIIKDLTKEKSFIEDLKENEYILKQAQRTAKLGHWSYNIDLADKMVWSSEMKRILELETPIGFFEFFRTMVHDADKEKVEEVFSNYTKIPKEFDLHFRIVLADNRIKFIHTKGESSILKENNICRGIIQDVTANYEQGQRILFESRINETLANAGTELISPTISIDNIVRTIFKACLELTQSETGFVSYDDSLSDKILIHFYDEAYINGNKVSNNIYFIDREKYKTEGLYGYPINLACFDSNNNFCKNPNRIIGKTTPKSINNYHTFPALVNGTFMGQIVLINSPGGFNDQHKNAIKTLSNIYGLAIFRKRMEWDLVAAKDKAEESDRLKSAFLANMSHEIRTPMNAIVGFSQLLIHSDLTEGKKLEFGNLINNSCDDLLTIVNDIIDISKIEAGQLLIIPKTVNLKKNLIEIHNLALNKARLKEKNFPIYLENNVTEDLDWIIDIVRFKQIFLNLIDNAIKFTDEGYVTIGCDIIENTQISFYVRDTGIGIPRSHLDSVFESFRQVETTIDRNYGGTGLGLAISKNLVHQMGGNIKVSSKEKQGSEFRFDLPLRIPENKMY